jgi:prophage regulatory protein
MQHGQPPAPKKILRIRQVCEKTGMSRAWIYQEIKSGSFPAQVKLSKRAIGWTLDAVDSWIVSRTTKEANNE